MNRRTHTRGMLLHRIDPAWSAAADRLMEGDVAYLLNAHQELERRREQLEIGNTLAILQALARCCELRLPAPAWLAQAFGSRLQSFTGYTPGVPRPSSLDEIFASPNLRAGQPKRIQADREAWRIGFGLWDEVRRIAPLHRGLDSALRDVLSSGRWPVRQSRGRELVLMVDRSQVHLTSGRIRPLSRLWAKPRKQVRTEKPADSIAA